MTIDADGDIVFLGGSAIKDRLTLGIIDPEQKGAVHYYKEIEGDAADGKLAWGEAGEFYISSNGSVYVFDKELGAMTKEIFSWKEGYISNSRKVRFFSTAGENNFFAVLSEQIDVGEPFSTQLVWLTKTPQSKVQPRKTLTLGIFENNIDIQAYVDYFNNMNTEYWLEVKTYCLDFTDQELAQQARVQMMLDLVSGNGPDLGDVEFFASVLDVRSVDGKLRCISDSFSFDILIGREEDCGGLSGLTPGSAASIRKASSGFWNLSTSSV